MGDPKAIGNEREGCKQHFTAHEFLSYLNV